MQAVESPFLETVRIVESPECQDVARRFVEAHYPHVAQRIEYLRNPEAPDCQEIMSYAAFDKAYDILHDIAQLAKRRGLDLPRPYTFGTPDNGVQYEWRKGAREFHLEIIPAGEAIRCEYLMCESSDLQEGSEGELIGPFDASPVITEFLSWVEKGWL